MGYALDPKKLAQLLTNSPYPAGSLPVTAPKIPYANTVPQGMVQSGNIYDPSMGDPRGFEFVNNGYHLETLLPSSVNGRPISDAEAIERYKKTGQNFGKFENPTAAEAFARKGGQ